MDSVAQLRLVVRDALEKHLFESAQFFADKLVTLSAGESMLDLFLLATSLYHTSQYKRAVHILNSRGAHLKSLDCRYLAARCLVCVSRHGRAAPRALTQKSSVRRAQFASRLYDECIDVLKEEPDDVEAHGVPLEGAASAAVHTRAAVCVLRAKLYEILENRARAQRWYRAALLADVRCVEALEALVSRHYLTAAEEASLLQSLVFGPDCAWLRVFYEARLKKHSDAMQHVEQQLEALAPTIDLRASADIAVARAEDAFTHFDFARAIELTTAVLSADPYHHTCLPIHIACLGELGRKHDLFYLAHELADGYPDSPLAWFAVACYYTTVEDLDQARRYFSKATALDGNFGAAWLGFGHSFAVQGEHDQAMAAYRTAARLFKGSHLPQLCIGMEYVQTAQLPLAEQFVSGAMNLCATDPLVWNELGVICYLHTYYDRAAEAFTRALELAGAGARSVGAPMESTLFNLGHALRKLHRYDEAIAQYSRALALSPRNPSTYTALGFTYHLMGELDVAIEYYHKSLGLKPEDAFADEMLKRALAEVFAGLPNRQVAERHLTSRHVAVPLL